MQHASYDQSTDTSNTRVGSHRLVLNNTTLVFNEVDANLRIAMSAVASRDLVYNVSLCQYVSADKLEDSEAGRNAIL